MGGLKLPPQTLHGIHGGRRPLTAPSSKPAFTIQPNYSSSISTGKSFFLLPQVLCFFDVFVIQVSGLVKKDSKFDLFRLKKN